MDTTSASLYRCAMMAKINMPKEEQTKLNDCYFDKKDWRACKNEVSCIAARINRFRAPTFLASCFGVHDSTGSERKLADALRPL